MALALEEKADVVLFLGHFIHKRVEDVVDPLVLGQRVVGLANEGSNILIAFSERIPAGRLLDHLTEQTPPDVEAGIGELALVDVEQHDPVENGGDD